MFSISLVFHFRLFLCFLWFLLRWPWWPRLCFPEELISVKVVLLLRLAMDFLEWLLSSQYLPVKLVKHLHVFGGLRHLPPFRHGGEHIAVKEMIFRISNILILKYDSKAVLYFQCMFCLPFLQFVPEYPTWHSQVFGAIHRPPFRQPPLHLAKISGVRRLFKITILKTCRLYFEYILHIMRSIWTLPLWQNLPLKPGGQRHRFSPFLKQTPPFKHLLLHRGL